MKQRNLTGNVSDSHKTHLCQAVEQSLLHRPLYSGYVQYAIPTRDKVAPVAQTRINRILRVLLFHFCSDCACTLIKRMFYCSTTFSVEMSVSTILLAHGLR
jgi:hypothetical protein